MSLNNEIMEQRQKAIISNYKIALKQIVDELDEIHSIEQLKKSIEKMNKRIGQIYETITTVETIDSQDKSDMLNILSDDEKQIVIDMLHFINRECRAIKASIGENPSKVIEHLNKLQLVSQLTSLSCINYDEVFTKNI